MSACQRQHPNQQLELRRRRPEHRDTIVTECLRAAQRKTLGGLEMHHIIRTLLMIIAYATAAHAQSGTLEITASYRERIAVPPDAQLEVQLFDVTRADASATRIASQRFAMSGVPITVSLTYDPAIIDTERRYALKAELWSGGKQVFRTTRQYSVLDGVANDSVDVLLSMVEHANDSTARPRTISGIRWVATELFGTPWINDDPATLTVDDSNAFSIFGGCNRFTGQLQVSIGQISFPENFAGTLMACQDEVEAQERSFLEALSRVSAYVRYGAGLILMDDDGMALMHFEARPE